MHRKTKHKMGARMMANFNRAALAAIATVALALSMQQSVQALTWAEVGDAGDLPGTAQLTVGTNPLTAITGAIGTSTDADMYRIHISNPAAFSATTVGTVGTLGDTQLFLFDLAGMGVYANDDNVGTRSTLPAGNINGPTTVGDYFIVITSWDTDPTSVGGADFSYHSVS